ncbi:hypothetical protein [Ohtaekwangia sp.]|uniref:hypothetical protein n=1 Tax=Ohtaekwangia sp. TaxID=2066019 RepID=UPI002FDE3E51
MHQFFENQSAKIYYDSNLGAMVLEYTNRVVNHEQFVVINTALLEAYKKQRATKFVADIRKMGVISIESQKWVVDILLPGLVKHLNGKSPVVVQLLDESEVFARIAGNNIKQKSVDIAKDFQVIQFIDRTKMEAYLRSV